MAILRQLTAAPPISHTLSKVIASDHTLVEKPRKVGAYSGRSGLFGYD
jgi:hypothetical protein